MKQKTVLLVEDNCDHAELIRLSVEEQPLPIDLVHLEDGEQALRYAFGKSPFTDPVPQKPDLILLDLRLPKVDGLDVLKEIKSNDTTKFIPVVVFTTSANDTDLQRAYLHHANSYLIKPGDFSEMVTLTEKVSRYWLEANRRPAVYYPAQ